MRVYNIFIGFISACLCLQFNEPPNFNIDFETLLNFVMEFHEDYCDNSTRCTDNLNETEQLGALMFPVPCCLPCSCSHSCRLRGNCCPDYLMNQRRNNDSTLEHSSTIAESWLSSVTVSLPRAIHEPQPRTTQKTSTTLTSTLGKTQSSQTKVASRMLVGLISDDNMSITTKNPFIQSNNDTDTIMNETLQATNAVKTVCVKPQMFDYINEHPDSQAYEMVASCPVNFQERRCDEEIGDEYLYDLIPVTSNYTGITYVIRHCLRCNELHTFEKALYISWNVLLLFHRTVYVRPEFFDNPQILQIPLNKFWFKYGNIHFVPPNPSFTQLCQKFDVTTCNHTGLWDMYDRTTALACEYGVDLPVVHQITDKPLMFKNSACLNCNIPQRNIQTDHRLRCKENFNSIPRYMMTINVQPIETDDASKSANKIRVPVTDNISLPRQLYLECVPGYVDLMGHCRKLLCPRDYFNDQNHCRPIYGVISGLNLYMKLKIFPTQVIKSSIRREFAEALKKKINDTVEKFMNIHILDFSLWYLPQSEMNVAEQYLYNVYFYNIGEKLEFGSAISSVQTVVNTLKRESSITLKSGYRIKLQYGFGHDISNFRSFSMIHTGIQSFGMLLPLMDEDWRLKIHHPYMTISDTNWCYRIAFSPEEFQWLSTDVIKIAGTNVIVYQDQFEMIAGRYVLVCANLFKELIERHKNLPDVKLSNIFITEGMGTTSASHWALSKTGILTWSVLGIILFCIVFYKLKTTMSKRYSEQARTINNIEMTQTYNNIDQAQPVNNMEQAQPDVKTDQTGIHDNTKQAQIIYKTEQADTININEQPKSLNNSLQNQPINNTEQALIINNTEQAQTVNNLEQGESETKNGQAQIINNTEQGISFSNIEQAQIINSTEQGISFSNTEQAQIINNTEQGISFGKTEQAQTIDNTEQGISFSNTEQAQIIDNNE